MYTKACLAKWGVMPLFGICVFESCIMHYKKWLQYTYEKRVFKKIHKRLVHTLLKLQMQNVFNLPTKVIHQKLKMNVWYRLRIDLKNEFVKGSCI